MFKRISNLINGFISFTTKNYEERHPEYLLEKLNNDIDNKNKIVKEKIIQVKGSLNLTKKQLNDENFKLNKIQEIMKDAIKDKNEELLIDLLLHEKEVNNTITMLQNLFDEINSKYNKLYEEYKIFKNDMLTKKTKIELLSKQNEINTIRDNIISIGSIDFNNEYNIRLSKLDDIINKHQFEIDAEIELNETSIETKIKKYEINIELEEVKKKAKELLSI
jgi:phage shock protein A